MTTQTLLDLVLGVALLCWIGYRQLTWTAVAPERMWRMPALLAIIGVVLLLQNATGGRAAPSAPATWACWRSRPSSRSAWAR